MHEVVSRKPVIFVVPGDCDLGVEQTVTNRSENVKVTSPPSQNFDGTLDLQGTVSGIGSAGVQIEVELNSATVYGPKYIRTDANGAFSESVPIPDGGTYEVTFSDTKGYIDTVTFVVAGTPGPTPTPAMISASGFFLNCASSSAKRSSGWPDT